MVTAQGRVACLIRSRITRTHLLGVLDDLAFRQFKTRASVETTSSWKPYIHGRQIIKRHQTTWRKSDIHGENPFDILGIPKASTYQNVKRRFIELALKHHPDVSTHEDDRTAAADGEKNPRDDDATSRRRDAKSAEEFIRLRQAFEAIRENADGTARLALDGDDDSTHSWRTEEEFQAWFYEETGHQDVMFKMDFQMRKEVIDVANSQSQGGLDKGGMWEMARAMAEQEKSLSRKSKSGFSVGIESKPGISQNDSPVSSRRRRKR